MLVLTVQLGDVLVVQTPLGAVRIVVGGSQRRPDRRRLGIDAPRAWKVRRIDPGGGSAAKTESSKELS